MTFFDHFFVFLSHTFDKNVLKINECSCEQGTNIRAKCRVQVFASPKNLAPPSPSKPAPISQFSLQNRACPPPRRGRFGSRCGTKKAAELSANAYSYHRPKSCKTTLFVPSKLYRERVQSPVYQEPSGSHHALEGKAEVYIVVAVVRRVVVAVRDAAILRVVVPTTAAIHSVVALQRLQIPVHVLIKSPFSKNKIFRQSRMV